MPTKLFLPNVVDAEFRPVLCACGSGPRSESCRPGYELIVPDLLRAPRPGGRANGGDECADLAELDDPCLPSFGGATEYIVVGDPAGPLAVGPLGGRSTDEYLCVGEFEEVVDAGLGGEMRTGNGKRGSGFLRLKLKIDDLRLPGSRMAGLLSPDVLMGVDDSDCRGARNSICS